MANDSNAREVQRIIAEKKERFKELACINHTTQILKEGKSPSDTFQQIVNILPAAWQYPERSTDPLCRERICLTQLQMDRMVSATGFP
jgi:hypothetical protein